MIELLGKPVQVEIKSRLTDIVSEKTAQYGSTPCLAIVLVGDNERSEVYIKQKSKFAEDIGAEVQFVKLPKTISLESLCEEIKALSLDASVHGIILQLPLPDHFSKSDAQSAIDCIAVSKDADGLTTANSGALYLGDAKAIIPATARAVMQMIEYYKLPVAGKQVVVIGRSHLVGKPLLMQLAAKDATVTLCHSKTEGLSDITKRADIVVVAVGKPCLIDAAYVHAGQSIIDVGISFDENGKLCGDVDAKAVAESVHALSPVPGGVGPLTVAGLFQNVIDLYLKAHQE